MRWVVSFAIAGAILTTAASAAQAQCQRLWVERNSIYRDAGYCFKTDRAIRYFGNAGCAYDNEGALPLSGWQRQRIAQILADERANGCR